MAKDEAWKAHVEEYDRDRFDSTSRHRRHCFDAGWEAALADTLGMLGALAKRLDTPIELPLKGLRFDIWNGEFIVRQEQEPEILIRAEVEALLKGDVADADA